MWRITRTHKLFRIESSDFKSHTFWQRKHLESDVKWMKYQRAIEHQLSQIVVSHHEQIISLQIVFSNLLSLQGPSMRDFLKVIFAQKDDDKVSLIDEDLSLEKYSLAFTDTWTIFKSRLMNFKFCKFICIHTK